MRIPLKSLAFVRLAGGLALSPASAAPQSNKEIAVAFSA